jgi:hypothetical protein
MDLGEKASVGMIVDEKHEEDTCVFCQAKEPPKEIVNELTDEHDEDLEAKTGDTVPTYKFKNDAGKLGNAMGVKPEAKSVKLKSKVFDGAVAAHHLIPGNAALKESELFLSEEYLWKDGKAKGNIGYNINAKANGVWSPGNYDVRPWGTKGADFKAENPELDPKDFAFAAMEAWGTQFHDAHPEYSDFVKDCLDKVAEKLDAQEEIWCPEAKKKEKKPDEKDPLYILVHRINTISARMKRMLVFPTTNWKRNIYTSRFVEQYMNEKPHIDTPKN